MRLYIGILLFIFITSNNLWSTQNINQMALSAKQNDILAQLIDKKIQLEQLLTANNFTLSAKQLALLEQIETLIADNSTESVDGVTGVTGIAEIKKGAFIKAALSFHKKLMGLKDALGTKQLDTYTVNTNVLIFELNKIQLYTPLGKHIMDSMLKKVASAKTVQDVVKIFSDIVQDDCGSRTFLKNHYATHQKIYKLKEDLEEEQLEAIYKKDLLSDFGKLESLVYSIEKSINDPNYGPNKEKIKEIQEKFEKFDSVYTKWYNTCISQVGNIKPKLAEKTLPKDILIITINQFKKIWGNAQPQLTEKITNGIINALTKDTVSITDCADAMNTALTQEDYRRTIGMLPMFINWQKNQTLPNFDALIGKASLEGKDSLENAFLQKHIDWYKSVFSAVDSVKFNSQTRFYKAKVLDSLKASFSGEHRAFLLPVIESHFNTLSPIAPLEHYIKVWKEALNQIVIKGTELDLQYKKLSKLYKKDNKQFETVINTIKLPDEQEIHRAFDAKNRYIYVPPKLANGEKIRVLIHLNDNTKLTAYVTTQIKASGNKAYAIPVGVSLDSIENGYRNYEFSNSPIAPQNESNSGDQWVTPFEFNINFKKDKGSTTTGTEVTHENNSSTTNEHGSSSSHTGSINVITGGSISVTESIGVLSSTQEASLHVDAGYAYTKETSSSNAFTTGSSESKMDKDEQTVNKGIDMGSFNVRLTLISDYIPPAQPGNNATIDLSVNVTDHSPKWSKGFQITSIMPEAHKGIPATKK
ncbi:hypothetical protein [Aureispira anguillae]|uniref:Uncharacterized protein n=1 Tax=Aureispira anguillae TaxID=2864201 RepID=A0A915VMT2_9BACT|nr:hypothetical protein [Aureispira anguillae]BDS09714.1 hypothetical protein AsAng_0004190 [Aureispira anguillae]